MDKVELRYRAVTVAMTAAQRVASVAGGKGFKVQVDWNRREAVRMAQNRPGPTVELERDVRRQPKGLAMPHLCVQARTHVVRDVQPQDRVLVGQ